MSAQSHSETNPGRERSKGAFFVGYVLAGTGFVLLFAALARLLPLFDRFAESTYGKLLVPASIAVVCVGGFLRHRAWKMKKRSGSSLDRPPLPIR